MAHNFQELGMDGRMGAIVSIGCIGMPEQIRLYVQRRAGQVVSSPNNLNYKQKMGCVSSKETTTAKSMMTAFLPDEQTALLNALDSSKSTGNMVQLRSKYAFVPESFLVALNNYVLSFGTLGEASLSTAIYNLRNVPIERNKFYEQGYRPNHVDGTAATRKFIQDLGQIAMGFYPQPNASTSAVSQRFVDFLLSPKIGADAKMAAFPDSPPNNVYANNLWKLAIERLFLTDSNRLVCSVYMRWLILEEGRCRKYGENKGFEGSHFVKCQSVDGCRRRLVVRSTYSRRQQDECMAVLL